MNSPKIVIEEQYAGRLATITVGEYHTITGTANVNQRAKGFGKENTVRAPEIGWYGTTTDDLAQVQAMLTAITEAVKIATEWQKDTGKLARDVFKQQI
jgi:hypothetical protein